MDYLGLANTILYILIYPLLVNIIFEWVVKPLFHKAKNRKEVKRNEALSFYYSLVNKNDTQLLIEYMAYKARFLMWIITSMSILIVFSVHSLTQKMTKSSVLFNSELIKINVNSVIAIVLFITSIVVQRYIVRNDFKMNIIYKYINDKDSLMKDLYK